jgi:hypothetical protein
MLLEILMKKNAVRKLHLSRETVHRLSHHTLAGAAAGGGIVTVKSLQVSACCTDFNCPRELLPGLSRLLA